MSSARNFVGTSLCSYLGALSFGYVIGFSSPALPMMQVVNEPMYQNPDAVYWFGSVMTLGAMLGCPAGGWLVGRFRWKVTLMITSLLFLTGWLFIFFGNSMHMLYTGRVLTGLGSGMVCVVSPLYIAETSTKEHQGMFGSGVSISIGVLVVYSLGLTVSWRVLALIGAVIPIVAASMMFCATETSRSMLNTDQKSETDDKYRDMENTVLDKKAVWSEFRKPELFRPLLMSVMIMIFQQLSGINVVMFYAVSICKSAGFINTSGLATVLIGAVQVVGALAACFLMARVGRKYLLMVTGIGMALSCLALGACYRTAVQPVAVNVSSPEPTAALTSLATHDLRWLAISGLVGYILAFALGWGPIPWLLMSEIFPERTRGVANAVASMTHWLVAFFITKEFAILQSVLGRDGTFWFFGACCFVVVVFVWHSVPGTNGELLSSMPVTRIRRQRRPLSSPFLEEQ